MEDLTTKIEAISSDLVGFTKENEDISVSDAESETMACTALGNIKSRLDKIEYWRKFFTKPLNDQVKQINNMFKMQKGPLEILNVGIRKKVADFNREQQAKIEASKEIVEVAEPTIRTEAGKVTKKKVWKWEIEDLEVLRKSHPELFTLNEKLLNDLVRAGSREIQGVRIFQDVQISVTQ
jgi:hypothetical protein